jgi:hypothetical protein
MLDVIFFLSGRQGKKSDPVFLCLRIEKILKSAVIKSPMTDTKTKECKSCLQVKPLDAFYKNAFSPDGYYSFCKVCYDLLIKGNNKDQNPLAGFQRKCEKCNRIKLLNEFYEKPKSLPGKESWCKSCQQAYVAAGKQTQTPSLQPLKEDQEVLSMEAIASQNPDPQEVYKQHGDEWGLFLELEVDEIRRLLGSKLEETPPPKPLVDIMLKDRRCNGCGKLEPVIEVRKRVMLPVHAWFCDVCRANKTRMSVRRGFVVYDFYGRAYKIKKVVNDELLEGVLQKEDGRWDKRKVKIYGSWTLRK